MLLPSLMRFNLQLWNLNQMPYLSSKTLIAKLLPRENSSWKNYLQINEIKCIPSIHFFLHNSQFTWVRKFTNFEIKRPGSFSYLRKTSRVVNIKSCWVRSLKISKELKKLPEDEHKFVKKTTSNIISNKFTILKPVGLLGN